MDASVHRHGCSERLRNNHGRSDLRDRRSGRCVRVVRGLRLRFWLVRFDCDFVHRVGH
jgi:hypothetical protein